MRSVPGPAWRRRQILVACTSLLTYYMLGYRTIASFTEFVLPDLTGVLVHDRYHAYDHPRLGTLIHQLCCAHLLRDLEDAAQSHPGADWPAAVTAAITSLIHAATRARGQGLAAVPASIRDPLAAAYRDAVTTGLADLACRACEPPAQPPPQPAAPGNPRDREQDVLRFTTDLRITPTSNQAERTCDSPRPRKTSPSCSLHQTTRHRYAIRGYISIASKHNADILTTLRNAIRGHPMPPIADLL